jgi:TonB family protein
VDPQGNVAKVGVISSSHPDFEAPAVEALLKWRFRPGLKDGKPVPTHMKVPIIFELVGRRLGGTMIEHSADGIRVIDAGGVDPWRIPRSPASGVPPEYRYDEPPKPLIITAPVYPYDLLVQKVSGKADVTFAIDPDGRAHVVRLESASRPEFGQAMEAMVASWQFEPATKKGKPCWAVLRKEEEFSWDSEDFPMDASTERLLRLIKKNPAAILSSAAQVSGLDEPIKPRFTPGPIVPDSVRKLGTAQHAMVEFIVDHAGHARLPRIVSSTNQDFGWAATTAVARWQFTIPALKGRPVDVRIRVPLEFHPEKTG